MTSIVELGRARRSFEDPSRVQREDQFGEDARRVDGGEAAAGEHGLHGLGEQPEAAAVQRGVAVVDRGVARGDDAELDQQPGPVARPAARRALAAISARKPSIPAAEATTRAFSSARSAIRASSSASIRSALLANWEYMTPFEKPAVSAMASSVAPA